jgi:hypothetical protein
MTSDLLDRIREEFREMPGLSLTEAQAARLWQLEEVLAVTVLAQLVETKFLRRTPDGFYRRPGAA